MTIQIGDTAPDFTLASTRGENLTLSEAWSESPVLLVFFPLAFSGTCQGELCAIRDNLSIFEDAAVRVIGISVDSGFSQAAWAEQQNYTFDLVSDFWPHGATAQAYGVFLEEAGIATRASFLIDGTGTVVWETVTDPGTPRSLEGYREAIAALG